MRQKRQENRAKALASLDKIRSKEDEELERQKEEEMERQRLKAIEESKKVTESMIAG